MGGSNIACQANDTIINEFRCTLDQLNEKFNLLLFSKFHIIVDHYTDYFKETGKNLKLSNAENHTIINF